MIPPGTFMSPPYRKSKGVPFRRIEGRVCGLGVSTHSLLTALQPCHSRALTCVSRPHLFLLSCPQCASFPCAMCSAFSLLCWLLDANLIHRGISSLAPTQGESHSLGFLQPGCCLLRVVRTEVVPEDRRDRSGHTYSETLKHFQFSVHCIAS